MECVEEADGIVDLVKSFPTTAVYLVAKIGVDTAENGAFKI